jgi:hypothetical protein
MSEINHFKKFILCKIMWHDVMMICPLLDYVAVDKMVDDMNILHMKRIALNNL